MLKSASIPPMIRSGPLLAELALLVLVAGVVAEAKQRRRNEVAVWFSENAGSNLVRAEDVVGLWLPGEPDPIETVCVRARAILRMPAAIKAVAAIAEGLGSRSRLDGAEIAAICSRAFKALFARRPESGREGLCDT